MIYKCRIVMSVMVRHFWFCVLVFMGHVAITGVAWHLIHIYDQYLLICHVAVIVMAHKEFLSYEYNVRYNVCQLYWSVVQRSLPALYPSARLYSAQKPVTHAPQAPVESLGSRWCSRVNWRNWQPVLGCFSSSNQYI